MWFANIFCESVACLFISFTECLAEKKCVVFVLETTQILFNERVINEIWYIYIRHKYYSALKRNKSVTHVNLEVKSTSEKTCEKL